MPMEDIGMSFAAYNCISGEKKVSGLPKNANIFIVAELLGGSLPMPRWSTIEQRQWVLFRVLYTQRTPRQWHVWLDPDFLVSEVWDF